MAAIGDRAAAKVSTCDIDENSARSADKRRQPTAGALIFYQPEEIDTIGRALKQGLHRDPTLPAVNEGEKRAQAAEDHQDAEIIRLAAYAGLRLGELLALRWQAVDFSGCAITVDRATSAGALSSTKSGQMRRVPLAGQAAAALDGLSLREHYTSIQDLVFCNVLGRCLDGSAYADATSAPSKQQASPCCASTTCDTPSGRCSPPAASTSSQSETQWATATSQHQTLPAARPASQQAHALTSAFTPAVSHTTKQGWRDGSRKGRRLETGVNN